MFPGNRRRDPKRRFALPPPPTPEIGEEKTGERGGEVVFPALRTPSEIPAKRRDAIRRLIKHYEAATFDDRFVGSSMMFAVMVIADAAMRMDDGI